jgi:hypothetical protein
MNEEEELTCFAGLAMQALIAKLPPYTGYLTDEIIDLQESVARGAWLYAEAMMAAKKRRKRTAGGERYVMEFDV